MAETKGYTLQVDGEKLIFRTSSYSADKGSVLHEGIYNNEFASMMTAVIICGSVYVVIAFGRDLVVMHYAGLVLLFAALFVILRKFIFRERELTALLDRGSKTAMISSPGLFAQKETEIPFSDIASVEAGNRTIAPANRDGEKFVQKISRQHGSAVPGLADDIEFITLSLMLVSGQEQLLYSVRKGSALDGEPYIPLTEIREFIKGK